jgi:phage gp36-like protein
MAYSTKADVIKITGYSAVTDFIGNDAGYTEDQVIDELIANADALVDAWVKNRYDVPFTGTVPPMIERCSKYIAALDLVAKSQTDSPEYQHIKDQADICFEWLKAVNSGAADIPGASGTKIAAIVSNKGDLKQDFTRDRRDEGGTLDNFGVSRSTGNRP